jgi:glycosyltransferase involved in cell wall biosynthesis
MSTARDRAPHIALFIADLEGGGAQRKMVTLANAFAERGHPVDLAVVDVGGILTEQLVAGVRVVPLKGRWSQIKWIGKKKRRRVLSCVPKLAQYLRRERPAVLMSTSHSVNVAAAIASRLAHASTRLVLRIDSLLSRSPELAGSRAQTRRLRRARGYFTQADHIIAISHGVREDLLEHLDYPPERVTAIHNPIPLAELAKNALQPHLHPWLESGPPVVLSVGRLVKQKDFGTLVRAFSRVRRSMDVRLLFLGEGPERPALEKIIAELDIGRDVDLAGFDRNPAAAMARARVFVLSSAWEGFGNVIVEAMACGCPVVSTDCRSGPREILEDGRFGRLVPVGDDEALAAAIIATLEEPSAPERLVERAGDFAVDRIAERYLDVLLNRCASSV